LFFESVVSINERVAMNLEVTNFMNLAVRTHKPLTFDMTNHHESNVALDAAQAFTQSNAGRRFWSFHGRRFAKGRNYCSQQWLVAIVAQGHHTNQNYSY
jgi:hypothetical protein